MIGVVRPKALKKGDTIGMIAPSEPITQLQVDKISRFLEKNGYKLKTGPNVLKKIGDFSAGTGSQRGEDFNFLFSDPDVSIIFVAQGGMTASQMLEKIDFDTVAQNPKILAGYSDATTLQLATLAKTGLVTVHCPNLLSLPEFQPVGYTMSNFWKVLTTTSGKITITPQSVWQEIVPGSATGVIFGGNLSCLCKLLGTAWDPIASLPKIFGPDQKYLFFWEEVEDQFSEIVRDLWQVRNTGFFAHISGMIVGKLTSVAEKSYQNFPSKKSLIYDVAGDFGFPIIYGFDFGHDVPRATIPIGVTATMDTKSMRLEVEPGVV